ncbi:S-adenosyl-L-homocysteine hydrolase [Methanocalculus chunghsingensis]|uniref:Adenosylhomocysteinase n=1 Tax=Methanocalculus chunghsingensis TaxID=156457 RepID=A0A8J7W7Z8_9EURY|nr:adenosylhomocysteinase [Methanocalculus chunghsingensis]MBR1369188.1 S-adenosyl-L-homocysteine hydrolase [Methanocalculus chunghsingensis]
MQTGEEKIRWAEQYMPVLREIRERFIREQPFEGIVIGMALHVEAKTAILARTLAAGGAEVHITGCNPLSTQDDVASALSGGTIHCYAKRACSLEEYYEAIDKVLDARPSITIDDGMDLIHRLHTGRRDILPGVLGGCEETTTGIHRLKSMAAEGKLRFPVIAVNDTPMKHFFDNVHGTGESALTAIMATTNILIAGKHIVVAGYGYCGRGLATKARALGARVIITEIDPRRALQAHFDGFEVMTIREASRIGELFVTTTGNIGVLKEAEFGLMRNGAILCNAGHFNVEIDIGYLETHADTISRRDGIDSYTFSDRTLHVLAEGRLVNLAVPKGMGHPIEVMDLSFAVQALSTEYMVRHGKNLIPGVHDVPTAIDEEIARLKLASLGCSIDSPTAEQEEYMASWDAGT